MRRIQAPLALVCTSLLLCGPLIAQNAIQIEAPKGGFGWLTRPYQRPEIPPINLTNSTRLELLLHAGNLYLSAQDVIALALENNLDIEIQRYGPILNREVLKRAQGGGILRNVGVGVAQGPSSVSLTGVNVNASGGASTGVVGAGVSSSGGIITQLGPSIPNLDPSFNFVANFAHSTSPQSNTFLSGTTALIDNTRTYQAQFAQTLPWGMFYQLTYYSTHNSFNSPNFSINPFDQGDADLVVSEPLLLGFGRAVNGRNILVAKNNEKVADLQFKQQVITTVSAILNLYWDLVAFYQDVTAKKHELATAQQLYEDNKKQVQIGTLAPIEVTRAEAQLYTSQQDLLVSQTNLLQQETVLKNALSKNGVASPTLADVHVIPLDTIQVPPKDELKPLDTLVKDALNQRVEIQQYQLNIDSNKKNLVGIRNGLKPSLNAFFELTNNGLAGAAGGAFDPAAGALVGSYNTLLGQIFKRDFPSYSAGFSLNIPLRNRAAQADYVTSELELRQTELQLQKNVNQIRVDVQNAVIGLQQARVRYDSAVKARILQQQTLDADRKKYTLGASTVFQVVQDQQALAAAESSETQALANYSHARIAFDQAMGTTLEVNRVSLQEALSGRVAHESVLPTTLPNPEQP
ncbi:MAG: TolC family protein [Acidobacteriaceae bacterium]|nr:TolC family protein [Acidobacteriaceae bacterium]